MPRDKGTALLHFLRDVALIRRKRSASYGQADKVLWLKDVPKNRPECRSPFLEEGPDESDGIWLEVAKKRKPPRPVVPQVVADWVRADDLDEPRNEPQLLSEITRIVERRVPDPDAPPGAQRTITEQVSEQHRLVDHPEVEEAWREYLVEKWEPWAREMRQWQEVQTVYEALDFMRRRLEEAEERYELMLAIGLLQWRDPTGTAVERHVLTAPAELTLDAARGALTVVPAATFDGFRLELDMLELQHRPNLNEGHLGDLLKKLDVQAWNPDLVDPLLRNIANTLRPDAQVDLSFERADRVREQPHLSLAPAIVLRERRPTAYEDLIRKFWEAADTNNLEGTAPWLRLLREGDQPTANGANPVGSPLDNVAAHGGPDRLLFPRPTNEEQRQIVERLQTDRCVLVKGPPGTGKSHTIANLICHLLAKGERIVVTAHAPKALAVLRDLLPSDIRDLCVTALGTSREDFRLLEEGVLGILRRKNEWRGPEAAEHAIEEAENRLREREGELARLQRDLRAYREAETHSHTLAGGYSGTAAQIARKVSERAHEFDWFPQVSRITDFPLDPSESAFLGDAHARFTFEARHETELEIGTAEFPQPHEFEDLVARLNAAQESAQRANRGVDIAKVNFLDATNTEHLLGLREAIQTLTGLALRSGRVLGEIFETILKDLLASADARWSRLADESQILLKEAAQCLQAVGSVRVELADGVAEDRLQTDAERRLAHFEAGGAKGFWIFAPRVVRETRYIVRDCRVDGKNVVRVEQLQCVRDYLELRRKARELAELWNIPQTEIQNPPAIIYRAKELTDELKALLKFFKSQQATLVATVLGSDREALASGLGRREWLRAIDALLSSREARNAQEKLDRLIEKIRCSQQRREAHPCLRSLENAALARNVTSWYTAWQERERVRRAKQELVRYERLLEKLDGSCPGLGNLLRSTAGHPEWQERVRKLPEAWAWAAARAWLRQISNTAVYEENVKRYHKLKQEIEKITEELVSHRAWKAFFDRLDERTTQSLIAWTRAVDRIGRGTGRHAHRHRRTAQKYLMDCVPSIPAWVMPLHKLWDSVDAVPGLFDTVIVDEASQAAVDALVLFLLAKRIIVVGDHQQNSPEAIGVPEHDIARLAQEHLNEFHYRDEFRPDTSLFDHAERTFGSHITLREHFRCVPEIIRFSNDLCYRDSPLIPLRQAPPERLPPLCSRFVAEGECVGDGQSIMNRAEAEALVETITKSLDDEAYKGKTMGVIALQGHAQAQLIERLLAERLDPKVIEERRLRCGQPATFQGDQRDVIFLSLVIAPNVRYRALTGLSDKRRFNVAMSRARDQVWLFHSVGLHDLVSTDLRHRLVSFFDSPQNVAVNILFEQLDRLERAARGPRRRGNQPDPYESWFEFDVALQLLRRHFRVRPQVDVAGYRIDLVVEGLDARIAVECDGDEWHGPEQYEQDMARQRQLERVGWEFVRVRASDFYADQQRTVNTIIEACAERGIRPVDFVDELQR